MSPVDARHLLLGVRLRRFSAPRR